MAKLDSSGCQDSPNKQPAVAVQWISATAKKCQPLLSGEQGQALDGLFERNCLRHRTVESMALVVVLIGVPRPSAQCIAKKPIGHALFGQGRFELNTIEMWDIPGRGV